MMQRNASHVVRGAYRAVPDRMNLRVLLSLLVLVVHWTSAGLAQLDSPVRGQDEWAMPSLLVDTDAVVPGKPFTVAVRFQIKENWHIYWQFPGDSGGPPKVEWQLPEGFEVGPAQWPIPTAHMDEGDLLTYILEEDVALLYEIKPPASLSATHVSLKAALRWLVCEKQCVPGRGTVLLASAVSNEAQPANGELFAKWRDKLPKPGAPPFQVSWERKPEEFSVRISGVSKEDTLEFFPIPPDSEIKPERPQIGSLADDGTCVIKVPISDAKGSPDTPWSEIG